VLDWTNPDTTTALHLIPIGQLCDDGLVITFNSTSCNFRKWNDKMFSGGTQAGKDLYYFNGNLPIVECVNIAHAVPNLKIGSAIFDLSATNPLLTWQKRVLHEVFPLTYPPSWKYVNTALLENRQRHLFRRSERG